MKYLFLTILSLSLIVVACKKDQAPIVNPIPEGDCVEVVSFSQTVQPLIEQGCATTGCHDMQTHESGFDFSGYQNISLLMEPTIIGSIRHDPGFAPMPFGAPKFDDTSIQKIECWIAQGKLNN